MHYVLRSGSLHSKQVLAAKLTQLLRKFELRRNAEISSPRFFQNDGGARAGAKLVTLALPKLSGIRFCVCERECAHVCELGHIQFSYPSLWTVQGKPEA